MFKLIKNRFRILALLILTLVLGAATYGFAAQNTVPDGRVGEGDGTINGYTVTNVKYELDSGDPTAFDWVYFDLEDGAGNPASATEVHAGIGAAGSIDWVECDPSLTTYDFECDLGGIGNTVRAADALHVAAAE